MSDKQVKINVTLSRRVKDELEKMSTDLAMSQSHLINLATTALVANYLKSDDLLLFADLIENHKKFNEK